MQPIGLKGSATYVLLLLFCSGGYVMAKDSEKVDVFDSVEVEVADLRKIQRLYDEARAEVNAGLDRLLVELEATGGYESTEPFKAIAEKAADRVASFMTASDELILGEDRSGWADASIGLAGDLVGSLVEIWKTLRGARSGRHDALVNRIDSLKWEAFHDV
jgi:hypothetical protein